METGNDVVMEAVKIIEGIVGELRGFDETPPPKKVWLDIANRLEKAFRDYREVMMSFMNDLVIGLESVIKDLNNECGVKLLSAEHK